MALTVWKETMIEKMKEPLVKALLQEIRRCYSLSLSRVFTSLPLYLSLSILSLSLRARLEEEANLTMVRDVVASFGELLAAGSVA